MHSGGWDRSTGMRMWEQGDRHTSTPMLEITFGEKEEEGEKRTQKARERKRKGNRKEGTVQWPGRRNSDGCPEWVSSSEGSLQCSKRQQQRWLMRKRMMTLSWCFYHSIIILLIRDGSSFQFLFSACEIVSPGWSLLIGHRLCTSIGCWDSAHVALDSTYQIYNWLLSTSLV